jgi:hypothetical protein
MTEEALAQLGFALWLKRLGWPVESAAAIAFSDIGNDIRREFDKAWGGTWRAEW